jgi:hypothetical protein
MVIEAPPNLVHWHPVTSVRFAGKRTFLTLECRHEREVPLTPDDTRRPGRVLGRLMPCRACREESH